MGSSADSAEAILQACGRVGRTHERAARQFLNHTWKADVEGAARSASSDVFLVRIEKVGGIREFGGLTIRSASYEPTTPCS